MLTRRIQIAALVGTEGSYSALVEDAAYAATLLFDPQFTYDVKMFERNPMRETIGALPSIPGSRLAQLTFKTEMKGSGTAGTPPAWAPFLRACGFSQTINAGVASNSEPVARAKNTSTVVIGPDITGTYTGAKNGRYVLTLESLVADTSATFRWQFFPDDGTAFTTGTVTIPSFLPVAMNEGLELATTLNPDTSTTGWRIGDQWTFTATSSTSVNVVYRTISTTIPCLDIAVYEDGRLFSMHSARANVKIMARLGEPVMLEFDVQAVPEAKSDDAMLTGIGFDPTTPASFVGVVTSLGGSSPQCYTAFDLDLGNTLAPRQCAEDASGYTAVAITDRNITGALDTEAALLAVEDPFEELFTGNTRAFSMVVGAEAGNIMTLTAQAVQVLGVSDGDRDGNRIDALSLRFAEPEFEENDDYSEIVITLT